MVDQFLIALRRLLLSPLIDVAYFAAGIVAHLASAGADLWASEAVPRSLMLQDLVLVNRVASLCWPYKNRSFTFFKLPLQGNVVMNWNSPESEMVAYRSFAPFFHLILCFEAPQVQLWALWAIQHVCSKNGKNFTKRRSSI